MEQGPKKGILCLEPISRYPPTSRSSGTECSSLFIQRYGYELKCTIFSEPIITINIYREGNYGTIA